MKLPKFNYYHWLLIGIIFVSLAIINYYIKQTTWTCTFQTNTFNQTCVSECETNPLEDIKCWDDCKLTICKLEGRACQLKKIALCDNEYVYCETEDCRELNNCQILKKKGLLCNEYRLPNMTISS